MTSALFPIPITAPQTTTLRTSGYWSRVFTCLNPNEVVFRAQASQTIDSVPFITFTWYSADVGAYGDVWEGMVCYLSHTTSIRDAYYRGRVRLAPSATNFYIDLNASILTNNDYIIVTRDTDLFARIRQDALVDGSVVYHDLAPQLQDHPNTIVLYDADDDGLCDYTPFQTGIPVDAAATVVDTWAWDVSGNGAVTIDDPTLEHPTFTFEAGYHYLLRVTYTDDNGQSNYQISQVYAVDRTFNAPVVQPVVTGSINADTDSGWTSNLTAYADVSTLIDRTHCAVWHVQHFGDDSSDPIYDNVLMSGRIRSDSIETEGSSEAGVLQQVTFSVEGLTAYLQRLRVPNDIIRATVSPDEWGEITEPNPYRMAAYMAWAYTTLTNIASFGVEDGSFAAYQIGGEPRGIDGGTALDSLNGILDPIKARMNFAPSGALFLARTASYVEDRSSLVTITTFELDDILSYSVARDSSRTYSQIVAFGGVFSSSLNTFIIYSAQAPSIIYGDGGDTRDITREILTANSDSTDASTELGLRASNDYAYNNPKDTLSLPLFDSYAGVLIPTNYQRWCVDFPASSNTLGIAYPDTRYWQLESVSLTINTDGSIDVSGDFPAETSLEDAQRIAGEQPVNIEDAMPVLPVLPNDLAFPTDPLELYPTDTPTTDDYQPIDPFSGMQAYSPLPPDVAGAAAARVGNAGCQTIRANFRSSANATGSKVTTLSAPYVFSAVGRTRYGNLTLPPDQLFTVYGSITFLGGTTWRVTTNGAGQLFWGDIGDADNCWTMSFVVHSGFISTGTCINCAGASISFGSLPASVRYFDMAGAAGSEVDFTFTDGPPDRFRDADAFYIYDPDNPDVPSSPLGPTQGLFIDNSYYSGVPPYDQSHNYTGLPFTGTGNAPLVRVQFDSYAAKDNNYLFTEFCRA